MDFQLPNAPTWCKNARAECRTDKKVQGHSAALSCEPTLDTLCGCTPGAYCPDHGALCPAALDANVTTRERALHPGACCYDLPMNCVAPWQGRVFRDEAGDAIRARDGDRWARAAFTEYAAIASFLRVAEELSLAGAPTELVLATRAAAKDEARHAALLEPFAEVTLPRYRSHAPAEQKDLPTMVRETFVDACCAETLGAVAARDDAAHADDPELRAVLLLIAADEERHAELAWRTLAWLVREGGDAARRSLETTLAGCVATDGQEAFEAIVLPCAAALLAA
ncbi:MAG TPA: hypothetical protein VF316_11770 [Polyangiaceae bacterium]